MSFILDALKKSERERQRATVPGISDLPVVVHQSATSTWSIAIIVGLSIGVAALTWVWLRAPSGPSTLLSEPPPLPTVAEPAPTVARVTSPPLAASAASTRSLATEAGRGATRNAPLSSTTPAAASAEPASTQSPRPVVTEAPMSILDARAAGMPVPELSLELLVFSDDPQRRFVFVNGVKYVEGETLAEGPRVVEITNEGPILSYAGRDYLLPQN